MKVVWSGSARGIGVGVWYGERVGVVGVVGVG